MLYRGFTVVEFINNVRYSYSCNSINFVSGRRLVLTVRMSYLPPPPSYDESVFTQPGVTIIKCSSCNNTCMQHHDYCFLCGQSLKGLGRVNNAVVDLQPGQSSLVVHNDLNEMGQRIGDRLYYDFEKVGCCIGDVQGLDPKVKHYMHSVIREQGITPGEWKKWMEELDVIQKKAPTIIGCLCLFCFPGSIVQSMLCAIFCPTSMNHPLSWLPCFYGDWYTALMKWQENVNARLSLYGMYAKLVTYKPYNAAPRSRLYNQRITGKDENYEMSFLVIALNLQESRKLADESWDHGVNDRCTSGIGRCL